jgi:hypothetical protein
MQSLREKLEAQLAAAEARAGEIKAALRELYRIEALAEGEGGDSAEPSARQPAGERKSISQAVLEAITDGGRTIRQLADELGIDQKQALHAATSHRLRKIVGTKRLETGERFYYVPASSRSVSSPQGLTEAILELLTNSGGRSLRSGDIAKLLEGKVASSATNFTATVSSTLSTLLKTGKIKRSTVGYYVPKP